MPLSLISLNVEGDKHLDVILPFLTAEKADAICLQECLGKDIPAFERVCGPCRVFTPNVKVIRGDALLPRGVAIFSVLPLTDSGAHYYVGSAETVRPDPGEQDWGTHVIARADIEKEGAPYRILNTHGTWTFDGHSSPLQLEHGEQLRAMLATLGEFVLAGDLNARRGEEVFDELSALYTDNIPAHYESSIDLERHRVGHVPEARASLSRNMVDALFTTSRYRAHDVSLRFGVSDHAAVMATIEKAA